MCPVHLTVAEDFRRWAVYGFRILGPEAKAAIPELTSDLASDNQGVRDYAHAALEAVVRSPRAGENRKP